MSSTTPDTPTTELEAAQIADNSRVEDKLIGKAVERMREAAANYGSMFFKLVEVYRDIAEARTAGALATRLTNGHPDWARKSDAYKLNIKSVERAEITKAKGSELTDSEWRRIDSNIRNYTSDATKAAVVAWVTEHNPDVQVTIKDGKEFSSKFKSLVRDEYESTKPSNLTIPPEFRAGDAPPPTGRGRATNEGTAVTAVASNVEAMREVDPVYAALEIERNTAQLLKRLFEMAKDTEKGIPERVRTIKSLDHASVILRHGLAFLGGQDLSAAARKALDAALEAATATDDDTDDDTSDTDDKN